MDEEREQEDHLLYVALTRTLADGKEGSGILYLVCREASSVDDDDDETRVHRVRVKWPDWLPKKYRKLWNWEGRTDEPKYGWIDLSPGQSSPNSNCTVYLLSSD